MLQLAKVGVRIVLLLNRLVIDTLITEVYKSTFQVVTGELDKLPEGSTFVYVDVGGRDYWKNKSNEFR